MDKQNFSWTNSLQKTCSVHDNIGWTRSRTIVKIKSTELCFCIILAVPGWSESFRGTWFSERQENTCFTYSSLTMLPWTNPMAKHGRTNVSRHWTIRGTTKTHLRNPQQRFAPRKLKWTLGNLAPGKQASAPVLTPMGSVKQCNCHMAMVKQQLLPLGNHEPKVFNNGWPMLTLWPRRVHPLQPKSGGSGALQLVRKL